MNIKLLVAVGDGEILSLTISQELWLDENTNAHWQIDNLINQAMQREREKLEYQRWSDSQDMEVA